MALTLVNLLFALNAAIASFLSGSKRLKHIVSLVMGMSLIYLGFQSGGGFALIRPELVLACAFGLIYSVGVISAKHQVEDPGLYPVFIGFLCYLLITTENAYAFILLLMSYEAAKLFTRFSFSEVKFSLWEIERLQTLFKFILFSFFLMVYTVGTTGEGALGNPRFEGTVGVCASSFLVILAMLYAGVFSSVKESERDLRKIEEQGFLPHLLERILVPALILVFVRDFWSVAGFETFIFSQKLSTILLFLWAAVEVYKLKAAKKSIEKLPKLYLPGLAILFLYLEDVGIFKFLASSVFVYSIPIILSHWTKKGSDKIYKIPFSLIAPGPFSPFLWILLSYGMGFTGPNQASLLLFLAAYMVLALTSYVLLEKHLGRLGAQSFVLRDRSQVAILSVFVLVLFIAKIGL